MPSPSPSAPRMAADVALEPAPANPCCSELKKRYSKLEEKRNALRQAVKLLEHQAGKLQVENTKLKKAWEEERARAELEKEAQEKESNFRDELEKEVQNLKAEISTLQTGGFLKNEDKQRIVLLETRVLEGEAESKSLKEQLAKEKKRGDSEKKKAELEKKKAAEALKLVDNNKMEEEKRLLEIERTKTEEWKFSFEQSKAEVKEARERLQAEILKANGAKEMLEAEKQKVDREKKRADAEKAKVKELSRLAEADRRKMMEEKTRSDCLSKQLKEERQKRQELQKELESTIAAGRGKRDGSSFGKIGDMKLMKEKLKLERKQVKLAKRMVEIKNAEKNLLLKELHLLKRDFIHIVGRLDVLDGCYSQNIGGIDDMAKICRPSKFRGLNTRNKFVGVETCDFNSQRKTRELQTLNPPIDSVVFSGETRACNGSSLPTCRGHVKKPISDTCSELVSPSRGLMRNKSQNSAICSTTASFSDRQFVDSQGRSVFVSSPPVMFVEEDSKQGPPVPKISSELKKTNQNEADDGAIGAPRCSIKKRKIQNALESSALYSAKRTIDLKTSEKLSALDDLLGHKKSAPLLDRSQDGGISSSLDDVRCLATEKSDDFFGKSNKANIQQKVPNQQACNMEKLGTKDVHFLSETPEPNRLMVEDVPFCEDGPINVASVDSEIIPCFEDIMSEDYMKLLVLDKEADEERYRAASEMLLSPTLPEIEFPSLENYEDDYSRLLIEVVPDGSFDFNIDNPMPDSALDVVDLEIESNKLGLEVSDISRGELSHGHKGLFHSSEDKGCKNARMSYCVDNVTSLLLEELESVIQPETSHPDTNKPKFSVHMLTDAKRSVESANCELEGPHMKCDASCLLFKYERLVAKQTDCNINRSFCHFVDVVSLVELIGHYMGWDWTYKKIIPHLLKLLECCTSEELLASLFTLIGQLGRMGIEAGCYEQKGCAELLSSLSMLFDTVVMGKCSLPTQIAAVNALLHLLPFKFEEVVEGELEISMDASQLCHAKLIRKWFTQLSMEQQSLSMRIFQHDDNSKS